MEWMLWLCHIAKISLKNLNVLAILSRAQIVQVCYDAQYLRFDSRSGSLGIVYN